MPSIGMPSGIGLALGFGAFRRVRFDLLLLGLVGRLALFIGAQRFVGEVVEDRR